MCGIAGILRFKTGEPTKNQVTRMLDALAHRGPDGTGIWSNANGQIVLGHRRLSIIDLSDQANQPMHYLNRYVMVFNGEIYNYLELRALLEAKGVVFKTQSDSEVLLALFHEKRGACLQELDGMFAFAIWDNERQELFCARDRFGEKPFFYAYDPKEGFYFASEIKALHAAGFPKIPNESLWYNYLVHESLSNPDDPGETFYSNIRKIPQSNFLSIAASDAKPKLERYWNIDPERQIEVSESEAIDQFQALFFQSVSRRLRSDVPVGSSLSGGLDSSAVVMAIKALDDIAGGRMSRNLFSAQFPGYAKDESKYQEMVAQEAEARHFKVFPDEDSMGKNLTKVMYHQDEPFQTSSICAQYEVYGLARQNGVVVLLDGQGADELLAGYHYYFAHYFKDLRANNRFRYPAELNAYLTNQKGNKINNRWRNQLRIHIPNRLFDYLYNNFYSKSDTKWLDGNFTTEYNKKLYKEKHSFSTLNEALYKSCFTQGLENLLRFSDRNAMAHSIEVRLPFLSHELAEFVFSLPPHFKMRQGWTKWILRTAFNTKLHAGIVWRKDKIGFETPVRNVGGWMDDLAPVSSFAESIRNRKMRPETLNPAQRWKLAMLNQFS